MTTTLLPRLQSLSILVALSGGAKAANLHEKTTGSPDKPSGPPGAWLKSDRDRVTEILTSALVASERLLGVSWRNGRHEARRPEPFDERDWQIKILSRYEGNSAGTVAAEEEVEEYSIRNLRTRHGFDRQGKRVKPCPQRACSICPEVEGSR